MLNAVLYKDQFAELPAADLQKGGYIINMANSNQQGTHWVAVAVDDPGKNDAVIYFDSFGISPPVEVRKALKRVFKKVFVNDTQIQNINSGWCGIYCLYFLWFIQNGKKGSMPQRLSSFLSLFSTNVEKNLEILHRCFATLC